VRNNLTRGALRLPKLIEKGKMNHKELLPIAKRLLCLVAAKAPIAVQGMEE
jgi:hypothetical protein